MAGRAFSMLTVKAVDEEKRVITGIATTPEPDRVGDIVEPMGATFGKNLPLLWMHRHDAPVGTVNFGKPTPKGIPFEAKLPVISEPSQLKARIDEAWQSVKAGLVRAVSIGFRPLEYSFIDETGGIRFQKTEIYELSLVTVPANSGATINEIKSIDAETRKAALGIEAKLQRNETSGVSEKTVKTVKLTPKEDNSMTLAEQIKQFRETLTAKQTRLGEIAKKSGDNGTTFDAADQEEFDSTAQEITEVEAHIKRLEIAEKAAKASAAPVTERSGQTDATALATRSTAHAQVKAAKSQEPGIGLARVARCIGLAKGDVRYAAEIAKGLYGDDEAVVGALVNKAPVAAGTTLQETWANPLVPVNSGVYADFVEFLRPQTIIGKFGTNGIPSLRQVPFYTRLVSQTSGGAASWVGEGAPKPVTKFDFADDMLLPLKVAAISVATEELLNNSSPSADRLIRDGLVEAARARLDLDFIDPTKTASANISPASITNGVTPIASTGNDAEAVRCDLLALWSTFIVANVDPTSAVYVMSSTTALALSLLRNPLGQVEFPGLTMRGGFLDGIPVIVSEYVGQLADSSGGYVFLVNASDIYLGDDGGFRVDFSREASLQMDTAPTNNSATPTATSLVSMFQTNSVAFRAERTINWKKRRSTAVAVLDGVNWGSCAT